MLKYRIEDLSVIDETLKGLYKEHEDGGYKLDVDGAKGDDEFAKVFTTMTRERDDRKKIEKSLKELNDVSKKNDELTRQLEDLMKTDGDKVDKLVKLKVAPIESKHTDLMSEIQAYKSEIDKYKAKETDMRLKECIAKIVNSDESFNKNAIRDIEARVKVSGVKWDTDVNTFMIQDKPLDTFIKDEAKESTWYNDKTVGSNMSANGKTIVKKHEIDADTAHKQYMEELYAKK